MVAKPLSSASRSEQKVQCRDGRLLITQGWNELDLEFLGRVFQIILADLVLSGDNAVVIGMAARSLPAEQRRRAIIFGGAAAVGLRIFFTVITALLLRVPLLSFVGGLMLLYIALNLIRSETGEEHVREGRSMADAIRIIIVADAVMSLDNMLAVAASAHGSVPLLIFGLVLSIPLLLVGSGVIANLMNRFPWLVWLGAAVLAYTAGQMMAHDRVVSPYLEFIPEHGLTIPVLATALVLLVGWALNRRGGRGAAEEQGRPAEGVRP